MTRGWTLQELLAPQSVEFYDANWEELGTKVTLSTAIVASTGIVPDVLAGAPLAGFNIANRMSWAARRTTTRAEDKSYCLLGIFAVSMPLLYGKGEERAFLRLQEEILKVSEDYTIFAWASESTDPGRGSGLLASSVNKFNDFHIIQGLARSGLLTMKHSDLVDSDEKNYPEHTSTLTSRGLRITLLTRGTVEDDVLHAQFYRIVRRGFITKPPVLHFQRPATGGNLYERAAGGPYDLSTLETHEDDHDAFKPLTIYV